MSYKILNYKWVNDARNVIGFVHCENSAGEEVVVCGVGTGADSAEEEDAGHIADWGAKLTEQQARGFFPEIKNYKK